MQWGHNQQQIIFVIEQITAKDFWGEGEWGFNPFYWYQILDLILSYLGGSVVECLT